MRRGKYRSPPWMRRREHGGGCCCNEHALRLRFGKNRRSARRVHDSHMSTSRQRCHDSCVMLNEGIKTLQCRTVRFGGPLVTIRRSDVERMRRRPLRRLDPSGAEWRLCGSQRQPGHEEASSNGVTHLPRGVCMPASCGRVLHALPPRARHARCTSRHRFACVYAWITRFTRARRHAYRLLSGDGGKQDSHRTWSARTQTISTSSRALTVRCRITDMPAQIN